MINNKHKAEQDKATINQRVAEVPRMCMCMCVCMCVCVCARVDSYVMHSACERFS